MTKLEFTVEGLPKPAGSKRGIPGQRRDGSLYANVVDDCKGTKGWQAVISFFARQAYRGEPLTGALSVSFTFFMPRPKGHFGTGKNAAVLKPSAPAFHVVKPDALKLARAAEDAMTGIVYRDDAQIVLEHISKAYGSPARVEIKIQTLEH